MIFAHYILFLMVLLLKKAVTIKKLWGVLLTGVFRRKYAGCRICLPMFEEQAICSYYGGEVVLAVWTAMVVLP